MAEWNGEYVSPYAEHGKKSKQVKNHGIHSVESVKILTDERTRRQVNNLRHATNSELLCEAFCMHLLASRYRMTKTCVKNAVMRSRKPRKF